MFTKLAFNLLILICFVFSIKSFGQNDPIHSFNIKSDFYLINAPIDSSLYVFCNDTLILKKDTFFIEKKLFNNKIINQRKFNSKHMLIEETLYLSDSVFLTTYFDHYKLKRIQYFNSKREVSMSFGNNSFIKGIEDRNRKLNTGYYWESDSIFDRIVQFIDTSENGCFVKMFFPNGHVFNMNYNLLKKSPIYKFHKNGKLGMQGVIYYMEGNKISNWKMWNENGTLIREFNYNDTIPNMKEGLWKWWNKDGTLILQEKYIHDNLIDSKIFKNDREILKNLNRN